jgi:hypothetical protein
MEDQKFFQRQARECRAAAEGAGTRAERDGLLQLARHYEREAKSSGGSAMSWGRSTA